MKKNKFRVWDSKLEQFQETHLPQSHQQFIGILDKNLQEIYERDVVKFFTLNGEEHGEVIYSADSCAYYINCYPIADLNIDSLEIVGNMIEDYYYDDNGNLAKDENTNS